MRSLPFDQLYAIFYFICFLPIIAANNNCNYYRRNYKYYLYHPNSPISCISINSIFKCQYNIQQGKCLEIFSQNLGCSLYLNKKACINQLTNIYGENIYCNKYNSKIGAFFETCQTIDLAQVQKLGCLDKINKLACMNVQKQKCFWNNQCRLLKEDTVKTTQQCDYHKIPVNPYICQQIKSGLCMSNGFEGDYRCVEIRLDQLSKLSCNQLGLNDQACISITTDDQFCVFEDDQCKSIQSDQVISCNHKLNKNACISTMKHNKSQLLCEWIDSSCRVFKEKEFKCLTQNEVNEQVCIQSSQLCMYDIKLNKCKNVQINEIYKFRCNTPGLSRQTCLKIKKYNCSFYKGSCQELNQEDLTFYLCNMDLNETACVNLQNSSQYCLWNGNNCQTMFINQDTNCPLNMTNSLMKVNGNVCQAISKPNVICKYDIHNKLCITSSINDQCNTPFLNQLGCLNLNKNKCILTTQQTCQWTNKGCILLQMEQKLTTCDSLGYANPISCSQVYENDSIGCYYDKTIQQCKSILVKLGDKQIKQLLNTITCNHISQGINKVICGSITTSSTPCRWFQEQCVYFSKSSDIDTVPCLHLQFSNYQACALTSYQNEPCMYSEKDIGCINKYEQNNKDCDQLGLNSISCQLINQVQNSNQCYRKIILYPLYFDKTKCFKSNQIEDGIEIESENVAEQEIVYNTSLKCNGNLLTKLDCASIITKGQLCYWSSKQNSCTEISVQYNTKCNKFVGSKVIINPNVCASILTDQLDYCAFDYQTTNCKFFFEGCIIQGQQIYCFYYSRIQIIELTILSNY